MSELGYTDNTKNSDDKSVERFIRWLEGTGTGGSLIGTSLVRLTGFKHRLPRAKHY